MILNDVSMTFARGKVTAILGGSGLRQDHTAALIGGVYPTTRGRCGLDGEVVKGATR